MNPNDPRHPWARLTAAARRTAPAGDESAPYGFATRVAALALAQSRRAESFVERFALRAVGLAALLAIASVVLNYRPASVSTPDNTEEHASSSEDPMSMLLDA